MSNGFGPTGEVAIYDGDDRILVSEWWTSAANGVGLQAGRGEPTIEFTNDEARELARLLLVAAGPVEQPAAPAAVGGEAPF